MPIFQFTGLSGAGKTTLANAVAVLLTARGSKVEMIDGDEYRKTICADLGFSKADREENMRRLGTIAAAFSKEGKTVLISAINPFQNIRNELKERTGAKTIWIKCPIDILVQRDTKGLYKRAMLPERHPEKIYNLTGVNDVYDQPEQADLVLDTGLTPFHACVHQLSAFILSALEVSG